MKCGTTTLAEQLAAQPGVFMTTPKEPNFFSDDDVFARGLAQGPKAALVADAGIVTGLMIHTTLVALGLAIDQVQVAKYAKDDKRNGKAEVGGLKLRHCVRPLGVDGVGDDDRAGHDGDLAANVSGFEVAHKEKEVTPFGLAMY